MTDKMELTKHHKAGYGLHIKHKPNPDCCAFEINSGSRWPAFSQCTRKRHPDTLDGAFCKQHCPERRKAKQEAREAQWRDEAAAAQAERKKAARREELRDEAARILVSIGASDAMYLPNPHYRTVDDWIRRWRAAQ